MFPNFIVIVLLLRKDYSPIWFIAYQLEIFKLFLEEAYFLS